LKKESKIKLKDQISNLRGSVIRAR